MIIYEVEVYLKPTEGERIIQFWMVVAASTAEEAEKRAKTDVLANNPTTKGDQVAVVMCGDYPRGTFLLRQDPSFRKGGNEDRDLVWYPVE